MSTIQQKGRKPSVKVDSAQGPTSILIQVADLMKKDDKTQTNKKTDPQEPEVQKQEGGSQKSVLNYGGFGQKKEEPKEQQSMFNYNGFGQKKDDPE